MVSICFTCHFGSRGTNESKLKQIKQIKVMEGDSVKKDCKKVGEISRKEKRVNCVSFFNSLFLETR